MRALIFATSFHDIHRCETVSRTCRADLLACITGPVDIGNIPNVEHGEVLVDSRGCGSFQKSGKKIYFNFQKPRSFNAS
jgi:hypothetical protein